MCGAARPIFNEVLGHTEFYVGGVKVKEWEVYEAWPAVMEVGDLDAESSDVLIETLELANEGHRQTL